MSNTQGICISRASPSEAAVASTMPPMKIFLSHRPDRRAAADRLRPAMEAEDHDVFLDCSDLRNGEYFHERLLEAIEAADVLCSSSRRPRRPAAATA